LALIQAEAAKAVAELRAEIADLKSQLERAVAERLSTLRDGEPGAPGPKGESGPPGRDGRLRSVDDWAEGVHYAGNLVVRDGSTYQCIKDTGHPPPHEDWTCLARAGRDGGTLRVRGTWTSDGHYQALDIVALNGCSFLAVRDSPGPCPGDGWQLIAKQGQRGIAGPRGEKGDRGPPGVSAQTISGWIIDRENFAVTPVMFNGAHGPKLDLRPLFLEFDNKVLGTGAG
jgi:hypothetical protein